MKIVINACFGGFSLSREGVMEYAKRAGLDITVGAGSNALFSHYYLGPVQDDDHYWSDTELERDDPHLVSVVEDLGQKAGGRCSELEVIEIPDDVEWEIDDYDGLEHIAEKHRTWS